MTENTGVEWRPCPGYEDSYRVSSDGFVKSIERDRVSGRGGIRTYPSIVLKQSISIWGYPQVGLCRDGKVKTISVHRLVCEAFHGPCPEGMECRHLNGNREDNREENLSWGTRKQNGRDKVRHGNSLRGTKNTECKLTEQKVKWIKMMLSHGAATHQYLADIFGVSKSQITNIKLGLNWGWLDV